MIYYYTYICETCGKESRDPDDIKECEAGHLGLSVEEKFKYDGLKEIVRSCSSTVSRTKNEKTEKDFDDAIDNLIKYEKEHGISSK